VARGEREKSRRAGSCGAACTGSSGVASRGAEAAWVQPQGLAAANGRGAAVAALGLPGSSGAASQGAAAARNDSIAWDGAACSERRLGREWLQASAARKNRSSRRAVWS